MSTADCFKTRTWKTVPFSGSRQPTRWSWEVIEKTGRKIRIIGCGTTTVGEEAAKDVATAALARHLEREMVD